MVMLEIDLIRHVKVDGKSALYGQTDIAPLATENSRLLAQLITQQKTLKAYQSIICSPLQRCQSLAIRFAQSCQLPLDVCDDLQEMNFGLFDGVPFDNILHKAPAFDKSASSHIDIGKQEQEPEKKLAWSTLEAFFQAPATALLPQGESLSDFHQRVVQAWQTLIEQQVAIASKQRYSPSDQSGRGQAKRRVLLIAHAGVIRMIIAHILQLDWQQASWHQQLHIGHGSITRICLSLPYESIAYKENTYKCNTSKSNTYKSRKIFQQITTIAMPFLEEQDYAQ